MHSFSPSIKIPIAILGATGMVGQRMIQLLQDHPWFEIKYIGASSRSSAKTYAQACMWRLEGFCPPNIASMVVHDCSVDSIDPSIRIVLSALDTNVAGEIETAMAHAGKFVVSNASNHRMDTDVPLVIPEVNPDTIDQACREKTSAIITNPNCCAIPLALSLAPLLQRWTIESCVVSTWQAVSGAGYPGESAWDMVGSVHPHAGNEEEKLAIEPCKILHKNFPISARCVRVPVADGHLLSVQVKFTESPSPEEALDAWSQYTNPVAHLPSSPTPLFYLHTERHRPSPRFDIGAGKGMGISIGRVEKCAVMGLKYFVLAHNTIRGAAGAAIANAELLVTKGYIHANN